MQPEDSQAGRDATSEAQDSFQGSDYALAKLMQEQERALYELVGQRGQNEFEALALEDSVEDGDESGVQEATGGEEEEDSDEEIDDEALARRLFLAEQLAHQRRLMAIAGIQNTVYSTEDGSEEEEVDEESEDDEEEQGPYLTDDSYDPDHMTYEELRELGETVGVVSRGASSHVIDALPLARFVASEPSSTATPSGASKIEATQLHCCQEEQCVICRMEFQTGEDVKVLPCKHLFHPACVDQWLQINKACPICSKEVTSAPDWAGVTEASCLKTNQASTSKC